MDDRFEREEFPEIYTKRLYMGEIREQDIPDIVKYANNKNIAKNTINLPSPYSVDHALEWIEMQKNGFESQKQMIFGIKKRDDDAFVGGVSLDLDFQHYKAEMGYWIAEPFWNKGFASEACKEIVNYGFFRLDLNKIYATHFLFNGASEKVLQKIGMTKEALIKQHVFMGDSFFDVNQYRILREECVGIY